MIEYNTAEANQLLKDWLGRVFRYQPSVGGIEAQAGDVRICFAVAYYTNEADAIKAGEYSKAHNTYNGGMFHGQPCGRDKSFDFKLDGVTYYAVTH